MGLDWHGLPVKAEGLQHAPEKLKARHMQVRVRQAQLTGRPLQHQHMGVVGADIVLDQKTVAVPRHSGVQTRMAKLQRCSGMDAALESLHPFTVTGRDLPDMRPHDVFGCHLGRHGVDGLVKVHDQQVQAVRPVVIAMGDFGQRVVGKPLLVLKLLQAGQPRIPARCQCGIRVRAALAGGPGHDMQIAGKRSEPLVDPGHEQHIVGAVGPPTKASQPRLLLQTKPADLCFPVHLTRLWMRRLLGHRLHQTQVELQTVVGRQCCLDPRGQQQ